MSEQRGLRNTHGTTSDGEPYCESCGVCDEGWRCRCCLAAEVEALRAQVQAVREACEPFGPMGSIAVWRVLRALDGDNDA